MLDADGAEMCARAGEHRCTGGRENALWLHRCRQTLFFFHPWCLFSDDQQLTEGGYLGFGMHATLGLEKLLSPGKAGGRNADAVRGIVRTRITISLHGANY